MGRPFKTSAMTGTNQNRFSPSLTSNWHLRRRISFPVKVTFGETTREITLRGDRLSYDPTQPEAPLLNAGPLMNLLFPALPSHPNRNTSKIIIQREGWGHMRLAYGTKELKRFDLQPGDHLTLEIPPASEEQTTIQRSSRIQLIVPGTDFERQYEISQRDSPLPTLAELLTDTYAAWWFFEQENGTLPSDPVERLGAIASHAEYGTATVLPHPDFTAIRIRRLDADGTESIIETNLGQAIAEFTNQSTPEQIAQGNWPLLPGDIIELPLKKLADPWTGFTAQEIRYFRRLLSCSFQFTNSEGEISRRSIQWSPAVWLKAPRGMVPIPPESGSTSTRARSSDLGARSSLSLLRGERDYGDVGSKFFLREGDHLRSEPRRPRPVRRAPTPPANR
jgi:hypothetical protein